MRRGTVVGIDVGSSAARSLALGPDGTVLAAARAAYDAPPGLGPGEMDPGVWLDGLCAALRGLDCETPEAICVSGHGPTTVASSGELAITFRHPAGAAEGPAGQHAAHVRVLEERLGTPVAPRQMWDHLLARLGGDPSVQSVWPGAADLDGFGTPVAVGSVVGRTTGAHGVPEGIPLVPGSHDGYMTAWASGIDAPGKGFDPGGRTGGLGVAIEAGAHADLAAYGMPTHVPGVAIVGGPVASHGAILDWWSEITGRSIAELLDLAAEVDPGAGGVIVLPFLEGERAPRWNPELRAEFHGLSLDTGVAVLTRAILESTAYGIGHIALDLRARGVELDRVVCSGGPARSRLWTSIKAAVLEVPVDVSSCDEMAAYGAALGAGAAVGWWPRPGDGGPGDWPVPEMTTVEPEPLEIYRKGLERFIALGDEAVTRVGRTSPNRD
jgi:xylulokinase